MIRGATLFRVFMRSFFIQSSWGFGKMQGLGFASAVEPALKEMFKDKGQRIEALKRHLKFFNTQPYMASPVLGAALRLEEEALKGGLAANSAPDFKARVAGPYGALGDSFFWGSLRPMCSCAGALVAFALGVWGVMAFLLSFNVMHLWMRWHGLKQGYRLGPSVVSYIKSLELPAAGQLMRNISAGMIGGIAGIFAWRFFVASGLSGGFPRPMALAGVLIFLAAVMLAYMLLKKGFTLARLIYAVLIPLVIYGISI